MNVKSTVLLLTGIILILSAAAFAAGYSLDGLGGSDMNGLIPNYETDYGLVPSFAPLADTAKSEWFVSLPLSLYYSNYKVPEPATSSRSVTLGTNPGLIYRGSGFTLAITPVFMLSSNEHTPGTTLYFYSYGADVEPVILLGKGAALGIGGHFVSFDSHTSSTPTVANFFDANLNGAVRFGNASFGARFRSYAYNNNEWNFMEETGVTGLGEIKLNGSDTVRLLGKYELDTPSGYTFWYLGGSYVSTSGNAMKGVGLYASGDTDGGTDIGLIPFVAGKIGTFTLKASVPTYLYLLDQNVEVNAKPSFGVSLGIGPGTLDISAVSASASTDGAKQTSDSSYRIQISYETSD